MSASALSAVTRAFSCTGRFIADTRRRILSPVLAPSAGLAVALVAYGNFLGLVDGTTRPILVRSAGAVALGAVIAVLALRRGSLPDLGLRRSNLRPSLVLGTAIGLMMGLPGLVYVLFAALVPLSNAAGIREPATPGDMALFVFGHLLIATAVVEELAFRGLLQAMFKPALGQTAALIATACSWAAWHLAVNAQTLTSIGGTHSPAIIAAIFLAQNLAVLLGGLLLGWLRERTGNLAGCILAHWIADILLVGGFYFGGLG